MSLYQNDILDEEIVKQWGTHVSKKYVDKDKSKKVRKSSEAFLKVSLGFLFRVLLFGYRACLYEDELTRGVFSGSKRLMMKVRRKMMMTMKSSYI